jgi:hypothetical protein
MELLLPVVRAAAKVVQDAGKDLRYLPHRGWTVYIRVFRTPLIRGYDARVDTGLGVYRTSGELP